MTSRMVALAVFWALFWGPVQAQQPLCLCLRCAMLTHASFFASSGSMEPNLPTGTCAEGRYLRDGEPTPPPGSVVTFLHPVSGVPYVKRIVAHEGQVVQMIGGHLHIDSTPVLRQQMPDYERIFEVGPVGTTPVCSNRPVGLGGTCLNAQWEETLPNGARYAILDTFEGGVADDTEAFTVPPDHVFVLGDNRDNSIDSRIAQRINGLGFIPVENLRTLVDRPATAFE